MKSLHIVTFTLLAVGGINWILYSFGWNLVSVIFGAGSTLERIIYIVIGLSAIYEIVTHKGNCKVCGR